MAEAARPSSHAKQISVGNAASLFGAPGDDEFFTGLVSRPPVFEGIREDEEETPDTDDANRPVPSPLKEAPPELFGAASNSSDWLSPAANGYFPPPDSGRHAPTYDQAPTLHRTDAGNHSVATTGTYQSYDAGVDQLSSPAYGRSAQYPAPESHHMADDGAQYAYYPPPPEPTLPSTVSTVGKYGMAPPAVASPYSAPPVAASYNQYSAYTPFAQPSAPASAGPYSNFPQQLASPPPPKPFLPPVHSRTGAYSPPPIKKRSVTSPISPPRHRKTQPMIGDLGSQETLPLPPAAPPARPVSAASSDFFAELPQPRRASSAASHGRRGSLPPNQHSLPHDPIPPLPPPPARRPSASPSPRLGGPPAPAFAPAPSPLLSASPPPRIGISPPSPQVVLGHPPPSSADHVESHWAHESDGMERLPSISSQGGMDVLADLEGDPSPPVAQPATLGADAIPDHSTPDILPPDAHREDTSSPYADYQRSEAYGNHVTYDPAYGDSWTAQSTSNHAEQPSMSYSEYRRRTHGSISSTKSDDESAAGSGYSGRRPRSRTGSSQNTSATHSPTDSQVQPLPMPTSHTYATQQTMHQTYPPEEYTPQPLQYEQPSYVEAQSEDRYAPSTAAYGNWSRLNGQPESYTDYPQTSGPRSYAPPPSTYNPEYADGYKSFEESAGTLGPSAVYDSSHASIYDPYATHNQYTEPPATHRSTYGGPDDGAVKAYEHLQAPIEDYGYGPPHPTEQSYDTLSEHAVGHGSTGPDPLQRDRITTPLIAFGFGGRLLTCFPANNFSTFSAIPPRIRLSKITEICAVDDSFPGPLFQDSGWNKTLQAKKRKDVTSWLETRIAEREKALQFIAASLPGSSEAAERERRIEDRIVLIKLLKILIESDGKLGGSEKLDEAVRTAIMPGAATTTNLPTAAELHQGAASLNAGTGAVLSTSALHDSDLDKIQQMLLCGDRRSAMRLALDRKLWGHALVIASSVDSEAWREAVTEMIRVDLASEPADGSASNGRESLRVAYGLFAGLNGAAVYDFAPPHLASQLRQSNATRPLSHVVSAPLPPTRSLTPASGLQPSRSSTPQSAAFAMPPVLTAATLDRWRETAATIVANRVSGDSSALLALGDTLLANGRVDAAHCCFLLSSPTATLGGQGQLGARMTLVGSDLASSPSAIGADLEVVALTEIVEFALSLPTPGKGQEPYIGLPHLQSFRLAQAVLFADLGHPARAQRYCEAIGSTMKTATKMSPFYSPALVEQVRHFSERLVGVPNDKSGSWFSGIQRPKLDSLWSTLEDRVSKFVAGEGEAGKIAHGADARVATAASKGIVGPFSHYSSISPASTNGQVSRASSTNDLAAAAAASSYPAPAPAPPASAPPAAAKKSQPARPSKAAPAVTPRHSHKKSMSLGYLAYGSDPYAGSTPKGAFGHAEDESEDTPKARPHSFDQADRSSLQSLTEADDGLQPSGDGGWWSAAGKSHSQQGEDDGQYAPVPYVASTEDRFSEDASGFISPMGSTSLPSQRGPPRGHASEGADDIEDLGFGNTRPVSRLAESTTSNASTTSKRDEASQANGDPTRPLMKQTSSSWSLGRWFRRDTASPAPSGGIKANLGEETSFYYDPELKRWVNKKAGAAEESTATLAPPPRAQTASPTASVREAAPTRFMSASPPPVSPDPGASLPLPPAPTSRLSAPTPPPPSASAPPGPRKSTGPVKGKGGRRYVDVM